jgi:hypothetical protein
MRAIGYAATIGAALATVPATGRAATLTEDFTIDIIGGSANNHTTLTFPSTSFPKFDPSLGTLTQISETLTGSVDYLAGNGPITQTLEVTLTDVSAEQSFSPGSITIDLAGTSTNAATLAGFTGLGDALTSASFRVSSALPPGTTFIWFLGSATLDGSITYTYTIPEPSTWAMMLVGFAGLGYAGWRGTRRTA